MRILVIEDDPLIRHSITRILAGQNYEVFAAQDGFSGLEMAKEKSPQIILCDIMMPGMDGYTVLKELRKNPSTETIPFIFLSAKGDRLSLRHGMDLGADDYIPKPFTIAELTGTIEARLRKEDSIKRKLKDRMDDLRSSISLSLPHELLTPLNTILGFSKFLADNHATLDRNKIFEIAGFINQQGKRLHRVIENFLFYAELEKASLDKDKIRGFQGVTPLIKNTITSSAAKKAMEIGRECDLKLDLEDGMVKISETCCKKIIEELLDNSFKFSQKGTPVSVITGFNEGICNIYVIDEGRGMTREEIDNLEACMQFGRNFYEQQGMGLGLSIVKRLVEFSEGKVVLESVPGKEMRVKISLPA